MNQQGATVRARLEKVGQGWRRVRPYIWRGLWWGLVGLVVAGAIWALIYVPEIQMRNCRLDEGGLPSKICFDIENEARKTLAYILGGILAIIGIILAHRRIRALERQVHIGQEQLQVAQEGQITERFTRAIEQLGSDKMEIRLGGIYALERIANDSDKDYWPIMETLTAYVRERAPWRELDLEAPGEAAGEEATGEETTASKAATPPVPAVVPQPATDIQAVLTVLGRRKYHFGQGEAMRLDLRGTDLRGAALWKAHLEGANLTGTHLDKANLVKAHMERTFLNGAHIEGADLSFAHLEQAKLQDAHLERVYLIETHLEGADLQGAHLERAFLNGAYLQGALLCMAQLEGSVLRGTHLEGANLWGANLKRVAFGNTHLEGAVLRGAHLEGAELWRAHLERAELWGATGLTRQQLAGAIIDEKTILPDYLQEQPPEAKCLEGNDEESSQVPNQGGHTGPPLRKKQ